MKIRKSLKVPWRDVKTLERKKEKIEECTGVTILREENTNTFEIIGEDGISVEKAYQMALAVVMDFHLSEAKDLFDEKEIRIINLKTYLGTKKAIIRQKGRIIGKKGLARKRLEEITKCKIHIKGNKVGIIGKPWDMQLALKGIELLIAGKPHSYIFKRLEKQREVIF